MYVPCNEGHVLSSLEVSTSSAGPLHKNIFGPTMTVTPCSTSFSETFSPMPVVPPVTIATLLSFTSKSVTANHKGQFVRPINSTESGLVRTERHKQVSLDLFVVAILTMQPIFLSSGMGAAPIRDFNEPGIEIEILAPDTKIQAIYIFTVVLETYNLTICVEARNSVY